MTDALPMPSHRASLQTKPTAAAAAHAGALRPEALAPFPASPEKLPSGGLGFAWDDADALDADSLPDLPGLDDF